MNNQQTTLKQWLVRAPIFFAISSFLCAVILALLGGLLLPKSEYTLDIIGILMLGTTILSAIMAIRKTPTTKMDRTGIVTIFNTKMIILTLTSIISLIIALNLAPIQFQLFNMMRNTGGAIFGFIFAVCLVLVSLYVLGIVIMGLWACFLRARTMNIPLWKIICSIPFGFDMLWLPGYFIPNKAEKKPVVTTQTKWIVKLTNWTLERQSNTVFLFVSLIICTGIFNGTTNTLLSISMLLMFGIWIMQMGAKKFEKSIGGAYATTAVIINLAILIYIGTVLYII